VSKLLLRRVAAPRYADDLSGTGAARHGGRWNEVGQPVLYAAEHESLGVIEKFVHLPPVLKLFPPLLSLVEIEVDLSAPSGAPSIIEDIDPAVLPGDPIHPSMALRCLLHGARWVEEARSLVLRVPSVNCPSDFVYVINCRHPDFARRVRLVRTAPLRLPTRLSLAHGLEDDKVIAIMRLIES
jgi:RES domain-containing protein